jgi:hypothetical protein
LGGIFDTLFNEFRRLEQVSDFVVVRVTSVNSEGNMEMALCLVQPFLELCFI